MLRDEPYTNGASSEPYNRTCPQYFLRQQSVQQIYADLADYKRGALGNVLDLEYPYLVYLRTAESEQSDWENENQRQMLEKN